MTNFHIPQSSFDVVCEASSSTYSFDVLQYFFLSQGILTFALTSGSKDEGVIPINKNLW